MPEDKPNIFLSYARGDDEAFVKLLYERLKTNGFRVWWDREWMPSRALTFLKEIHDVIRNVERVVVVVGPKCITSDYCRAEWQAALAEEKIVNPLLRIGEYTQLPSELRGLHCPDFRDNAKFGDAFREIVRILREPVPEFGPLMGGVPQLPGHFQPRPGDISRVADHLLIDEKNPVTLTGPQRVVVIHGMGGIGKSVLAAAFARSTSSKRSFNNGVYWLNAGEDVTPQSIITVLSRLLGSQPQSYSDLIISTTQLAETLAKRRALLVLDNAWHIDQVEVFVNALGPSCRLLVTTRDESLVAATGANSVHLGVLTPEEALVLLADWTDISSDSLPPEALDVAKACGYLPFALALNGAMHQGGVAWSQLLEALHEAELDYAKQPFTNYPHRTVFASIKVSMDMLDREDGEAGKRLRELVAFDKYRGIPEAAVAFFWANTGGYAARHTIKVLIQLKSRSLIRFEGTPESRRVSIHELQYDYLVHITDTTKLKNTLWIAYEKQCSGYWPNLLVDGYVHQNLVKYLIEEGRVEEVHVLIATSEENGRNAWYEAQNAADNLEGYMADLDLARELVTTGSINNYSKETFTLQFRYAMIYASLNCLARALSSDYIIALVDCGAWNPKKALVILHRLAPEKQLMLLADLIPRLQSPANADALDEAFAILMQFPDVDRLAAQASMLERLEGPAQERMFVQMLSTIWSLNVVYAQIEYLSVLWKYLPTNTKNEALRQVYDSLLRIRGKYEVCQALMKIGPWLVERCDTAMSLCFLRLSIKVRESVRAHISELPNEILIEDELRYEPDALEGFRMKRREDYTASNNIDSAIQKFVSSLATNGRLGDILVLAQNIEDEKERNLVLQAISENATEYIVESREFVLDNNEEEQGQGLTLSKSRGNIQELLNGLPIAASIGDDASFAELMLAVSAYVPHLLEEGIEAAKQIADLDRRSTAMYDFSSHLTQPIGQGACEAILNMLREIREGEQRAEALLNIVLFLPKILQESIKEEAFAEIDRVQPEFNRAELIVKSLADVSIWENLSKSLLQRAFQTAIHLRKGLCIYVLSSLVPYLPKHLLEQGFKEVERFNYTPGQVELLTSLASRLSKSYANRAYRIAEDLEDSRERAAAFANLVGVTGRIGVQATYEVIRSVQALEERHYEYFTYQRQHPTDLEGIEEAQDEADTLASFLVNILTRLANAGVDRSLLESEIEFPGSFVGYALGIRWTDRRVRVLCELIPFCNNDLLAKIHRNFSRIEDLSDRAFALSGMLTKLSTRDERWQEILYQAFQTTEKISVLKDRVEALVSIVTNLTIDEHKQLILADALNAALQTSDCDDRRKLLALLIPQLAAFSSASLCDLWSQILNTSTNRSRIDLLNDTRSFLPVIKVFGGEEALVIVAQVSEDIRRWWP